MQKSSIWPQVFAAISASLIFVCSGFHYEWPRSAFSMLGYEDSYSPMSTMEIFWIVSCLFIGCICGAFLGLILVDRLGRRTTLLLMAVPLFISWALIAAARSFWLIFLARCLAGLGGGVAFMVTPMYIGEIAESKIRGSLCALMPVMLHIGQLISFGIGGLVPIVVLAIAGAVIPIVFATALLWAPESPYYYAMKRIPDETRKSVAWLRGTSEVVREVQQIDDSMALTQRKAVNFINLFTVSSNRKALFIIIGLLTCQLLSDASMLFFYFRDISYNSDILIRSDHIILSLMTIRLLISICTVFLTDIVGRRRLLLISVTLCAIFQLAEALYFHLQPTERDFATPSLILIAALIGYTISHALGIGTLPNVMAGEIFPCEVKALGLAVATAYYFAAIFGSSILGNLIVYHFQDYVLLYLFTAFNILSVIFTYFVVPETKGRSLSEIQISLQGHFNTQF